eukprot:939010-Rhodomonas_salina.1
MITTESRFWGKGRDLGGDRGDDGAWIVSGRAGGRAHNDERSVCQPRQGPSEDWEEGRIEAVIEAMTRPGSSGGVHEQECAALAYFSLNDVHTRVKIRDMAGIEVATLALQTHRESSVRTRRRSAQAPNITHLIFSTRFR